MSRRLAQSSAKLLTIRNKPSAIRGIGITHVKRFIAIPAPGVDFVKQHGLDLKPIR